MSNDDISLRSSVAPKQNQGVINYLTKEVPAYWMDKDPDQVTVADTIGTYVIGAAPWLLLLPINCAGEDVADSEVVDKEPPDIDLKYAEPVVHEFSDAEYYRDGIRIYYHCPDEHWYDYEVETSPNEDNAKTIGFDNYSEQNKDETCSFDVEELKQGQEYCFSVSAFDANGNQGFSNEVCATIPVDEVVDAPYGEEPLSVDDFEDDDFQSSLSGNWQASGCTNLEIITNEEGNHLLYADNFDNRYNPVRLTTNYHNAIDAKEYDYLEFDLSGHTNWRKIYVMIDSLDNSSDTNYLTTLKSNGKSVHVQIPLKANTNIWDLVFWPITDGSCNNGTQDDSEWIAVDNVALTK